MKYSHISIFYLIFTGKLAKELKKAENRKLCTGTSLRAVTTHYTIKPRENDERWTGIYLFIHLLGQHKME